MAIPSRAPSRLVDHPRKTGKMGSKICIVKPLVASAASVLLIIAPGAAREETTHIEPDAGVATAASVVLEARALIDGVAPKTVVRIDPSHRLIEGIATDGETIWVSSVLDRTIIACRRSCRPIAVLPIGLHPLGMAWDETGKRLWVTADCPPLPGTAKCERGSLIALDRSGRVRARMRPDTATFHPGDVSAESGEVFVSDSANGAVYRGNRRSKSLSPVLAAGTGRSAQGTARGINQDSLVVAHYGEGISEVDLSTGTRQLLSRENGQALRGIDGLTRCGSTFYGIYNGSAPAALIAFEVDKRNIKVDVIYEGGLLVDPTQITADGNRLLIVADAGWDSAVKNVTRTRPSEIVAIPLRLRCSGHHRS